MVSRLTQSDATTYLVTDYLYDDLGHLRYVIPPFPTANGSNSAATMPNPFTESNYACNSFIYTYHYDNLGRLIEKRVPGKGWEYIVYNTMDKPIMTQDANQKQRGYGW